MMVQSLKTPSSVKSLPGADGCFGRGGRLVERGLAFHVAPIDIYFIYFVLLTQLQFNRPMGILTVLSACYLKNIKIYMLPDYQIVLGGCDQNLSKKALSPEKQISKKSQRISRI